MKMAQTQHESDGDSTVNRRHSDVLVLASLRSVEWQLRSKEQAAKEETAVPGTSSSQIIYFEENNRSLGLLSDREREREREWEMVH